MAPRKARRGNKPIDLLRQQLEEYKKTGKKPKEAADAVKCYVCGVPAPKSRLMCIGKGEKDAEPFYRHKRCVPGSRAWMQSQTNSKWYRYYKDYDGFQDINQPVNGKDKSIRRRSK